MHSSILAASLLSVVIVACSSSSDDSDTTSYSGDPLQAVQAECEFRIAHKGCDGQCSEDALNVNRSSGTKCPGAEGLLDDPGLRAYYDCRNACDVTKTCTQGEPITEYDCACTRGCAAKATKRLQGLLAYYGDCYRSLPRCQ